MYQSTLRHDIQVYRCFLTLRMCFWVTFDSLNVVPHDFQTNANKHRLIQMTTFCDYYYYFLIFEETFEDISLKHFSLFSDVYWKTELMDLYETWQADGVWEEQHSIRFWDQSEWDSGSRNFLTVFNIARLCKIQQVRLFDYLGGGTRSPSASECLRVPPSF